MSKHSGPGLQTASANGRTGGGVRPSLPMGSSNGTMERAFDDHGLEVLDRTECLELLGGVSVARVGITSGALPVVVPVNITIATIDAKRGPEVIIRTVEGTKLLAALDHAVIAVEADEIEPISHAGWSVLVRGTTRLIDEPEQLVDARRLPLTPWASPDADRYIAVGLDVVSGRRIGPLCVAPT